jgi:hypothetical protein
MHSYFQIPIDKTGKILVTPKLITSLHDHLALMLTHVILEVKRLQVVTQLLFLMFQYSPKDLAKIPTALKLSLMRLPKSFPCTSRLHAKMNTKSDHRCTHNGNRLKSKKSQLELTKE